jgi:ABC-type polysaccharide/polyol phosphate transport system ATPase subunit
VTGTFRLVTDLETAAAQREGAAGDTLGSGEKPPSMIAVSAHGVWKTFRIPHDRPYTLKQRVLHPRRSRAATELHALHDVTFEVESGAFFGIIGRNGSGKSTMLKCLAGIYQPDLGSITVSSRLSPFIELGVGFNAELTARDNVVVNAALLGMSKADALARFPEIIRFAELEEFVDLKLKNYSSGMQVRLGFSAAIQAEADIYLVDEVLAVGDARFQEKCFDTFRRLKREGRTVIYVTHDLGTVERFCDRAMLLEHGEVSAIGEPSDVVHRYRQLNLEQEQAEHEVIRTQTKKRWGDGAAEIVDAWFEDDAGARHDVARQGEPIVFVSKIRFRDSMESPLFGTLIRNEQGHDVIAINTLLDGIETGDFASGEQVIYRLRFRNLLADGRYTATPAVAYQDAQRFADWWEEAASVLVRAERYTGGIVDLPHEAEILRSAAAELYPGGGERASDSSVA